MGRVGWRNNDLGEREISAQKLIWWKAWPLGRVAELYSESSNCTADGPDRRVRAEKYHVPGFLVELFMV